MESISLCSIHEWRFLNPINGTPCSHDIHRAKECRQHKASKSSHTLPVASISRSVLHSFIKMYCFLLFIWVWISFIPLDFLVSSQLVWFFLRVGVNFDRASTFFYVYDILFLYAHMSYLKSFLIGLSPLPFLQSFIYRRRLFYSLNSSFALLYHYTMNGYHTKHCNESWYPYQHKSNKSRYRPFNFQS